VTFGRLPEQGIPGLQPKLLSSFFQAGEAKTDPGSMGKVLDIGSCIDLTMVSVTSSRFHFPETGEIAA
jgi:hypothetical protein